MQCFFRRPYTLIFSRDDQPAQNAGDAGDTTVQCQEQYSGKTDYRAADSTANSIRLSHDQSTLD